MKSIDQTATRSHKPRSSKTVPGDPARQSSSVEPTEHDVAVRAFQLWVKGGCRVGDDQRYWYQAQSEIRLETLEKLCRRITTTPATGSIFIGHGRSSAWTKLRDYLEELGLHWDEFNRNPVAGIPTVQRLDDMLDSARMAFLVMTAEDYDRTWRRRAASSNVIHEVGLFQGRLGFRRAIILLERGCREFSNIRGLTQIRFSRGHIEESFPRVRGVLMREQVLAPEMHPDRRQTGVSGRRMHDAIRETALAPGEAGVT